MCNFSGMIIPFLLKKTFLKIAVIKFPSPWCYRTFYKIHLTLTHIQWSYCLKIWPSCSCHCPHQKKAIITQQQTSKLLLLAFITSVSLVRSSIFPGTRNARIIPRRIIWHTTKPQHDCSVTPPFTYFYLAKYDPFCFHTARKSLEWCIALSELRWHCTYAIFPSLTDKARWLVSQLVPKQPWLIISDQTGQSTAVTASWKLLVHILVW